MLENFNLDSKFLIFIDMSLIINFFEVSNIEAFIQIYNLYLKNNQKIQFFIK
jgi:hypothetical protein